MSTRPSPLGLIVAFALGAVVALGADTDRSGASGSSTGLGRPLPPGWRPAVMDTMVHHFTLVQRAEFRTGQADNAAVLDAEGWIGGDYNRFWWKAEAEQLTEGAKDGEVQVQALYSRLITPFWDLQAGLRFDRTYSGRETDTRSHLVIGLEGLMPYRFDVEPALAIDENGKVSFTFVGLYELLITQRLILQPRVELRLDQENQEAAGGYLAHGSNDFDLGLRLRYDITRQFSPYVGVEWHRPVGASAGVARRAGQGGWQGAVVFGVRTWF